jgi:hypothetical protein
MFKMLIISPNLVLSILFIYIERKHIGKKTQALSSYNHKITMQNTHMQITSFPHLSLQLWFLSLIVPLDHTGTHNSTLWGRVNFNVLALESTAL